MKYRIQTRLFIAGLLAFYFFMVPAGTARAVKIAAIFSQTGIAAEDNVPAIRSVQLAVKEINAAGGVLGEAVALLLIDNQSSPLGSQAAARVAVAARVAGVIGPTRSSQAIAAANVLQAAQIPMITPNATDPQVTLIGDYIFRACFTDNFQGQQLARYAIRQMKADTAVMLVNNMEIYSMGLASIFRETFVENGGQLLKEIYYAGNAIDFSNQLRQVQQLKPSVVFIPGYARDSGLIVKQAEKIGLKTSFIGGDGWDEVTIINYGGDALEGSFFLSHWHKDIPLPRSRQLVQAYDQMIGDEHLTSVGALAYDAVNLLANAVKRAGSDSPNRIRDTLATTNDLKERPVASGLTRTVTRSRNWPASFRSGKRNCICTGQFRPKVFIAAC